MICIFHMNEFNLVCLSDIKKNVYLLIWTLLRILPSCFRSFYDFFLISVCTPLIIADLFSLCCYFPFIVILFVCFPVPHFSYTHPYILALGRGGEALCIFCQARTSVVSWTEGATVIIVITQIRWNTSPVESTACGGWGDNERNTRHHLNAFCDFLWFLYYFFVRKVPLAGTLLGVTLWWPFSPPSTSAQREFHCSRRRLLCM